MENEILLEKVSAIQMDSNVFMGLTWSLEIWARSLFE